MLLSGREAESSPHPLSSLGACAPSLLPLFWAKQEEKTKFFFHHLLLFGKFWVGAKFANQF